MIPVSLFQALCHVVPWQLRRPTARDATLWHDAEFQVLLCELRYRPKQGSYDCSADKQVLSQSRERRNP
jgi:hypothetical protein